MNEKNVVFFLFLFFWLTLQIVEKTGIKGFKKDKKMLNIFLIRICKNI